MQLKTLRLLYAEDEPNIRKPIADTLRFYVKEVIEAKDGLEALELYKKHEPDAILCDILMPRMNGIEFVTNVREEDHNTPIVMITAHTEKEYLLSAVELHLEHYLVKPVTLPEIINALKTCVTKINRSHSTLCQLAHGYHYDMHCKRLTYEDIPIKLSKKQIEFLEILIYNCHRVVTYEELQHRIWKDDVMTDNAIRSLVISLRKKLPKDFINNLSGIGYKL
ncbi:MAG: response regulator transcription factor, partial [Campylobacteraceae bacterium]|nr:response regulator transcription factor [Campylobacteraceae bacterium]